MPISFAFSWKALDGARSVSLQAHPGLKQKESLAARAWRRPYA